ILGATDKAGTRKPVLGSGDHVYQVMHDWGELPAGIKYGNTHGVCEDSNGHIYVHHTVNATSESSDSMVVFDHKGKYVKSWGKGSGRGELDCPHGIVLDTRADRPLLMIADRTNHRVQTFDLEGRHLDFIEGTNLPCTFAFDKNGDTVVPDLGARVTLMDKSNR